MRFIYFAILNIFLFALIFSGCSSAYQGVNMFNLKIGMSKYEVVQALGKDPDNLIGAKQYDDGVVEVIQYSVYDLWYGSLTERYWLYFFNDKLKQWGRPGDWEKEADRVYEFRYR